MKRPEDNIVYIVKHAESIFRRLRWNDSEPVCPYCGERHVYHFANGTYRCSHCHKTFSDTSNTIFHKSHLKKSDWLVALYMMMGVKGISSVELSNILGINQKSAWLCLTKLRYMFDQSDTILAGNEIAVDEVYLGQNSSQMHLAKRQELIAKFNLPTKPKSKEEKQAVLNAINARTKQPVFNMNDGDKICLLELPNPFTNEIIREEFMSHSRQDMICPVMVSDCGNEYKDWTYLTGWVHETNNHSKGQFITKNGYSSNRVEGNFRWLEGKRSFTYVHYSHRLTQLYLNEFAFKHNNRKLNINDKLSEAFKYIHCKFDSKDIKQYDPIERFYGKYPNHKDYSNIRDIFKTGLIKEFKDGGLVWRIEDFR